MTVTEMGSMAEEISGVVEWPSKIDYSIEESHEHDWTPWDAGSDYLQWTVKQWDPELKANVWTRLPEPRRVWHQSAIRSCTICHAIEIKEK